MYQTKRFSFTKNRNINIFNDFESLNEILKKKKIDYTMNAITGLAGLHPTLKIIQFTKNIAIANKEAIICGWSLISSRLKKYKTKYLVIKPRRKEKIYFVY